MQAKPYCILQQIAGSNLRDDKFAFHLLCSEFETVFFSLLSLFSLRNDLDGMINVWRRILNDSMERL